MNEPSPPPPLSFRCPPDLARAIDDWIAAQPEPRPDREEAIRRLLALALDGVAAEFRPEAAYRATRIGRAGPAEEWRGEAADDEDAAHRCGQHLKTRMEQGAPGYTPDDMVTLIRPNGEIVTVAHVREMIDRLSGWKTAPSAQQDAEGEWRG